VTDNDKHTILIRNFSSHRSKKVYSVYDTKKKKTQRTIFQTYKDAYDANTRILFY
jgi:hypothetical protein